MSKSFDLKGDVPVAYALWSLCVFPGLPIRRFSRKLRLPSTVLLWDVATESQEQGPKPQISSSSELQSTSMIFNVCQTCSCKMSGRSDQEAEGQVQSAIADVPMPKTCRIPQRLCWMSRDNCINPSSTPGISCPCENSQPGITPSSVIIHTLRISHISEHIIKTNSWVQKRAWHVFRQGTCHWNTSLLPGRKHGYVAGRTEPAWQQVSA